jgi:acetyltransferase-like isoleucine patch superfamily enzyme
VKPRTLWRRTLRRRHRVAFGNQGEGTIVDRPRLLTNPERMFFGHGVRFRPGARLEVVPPAPGASVTGSIRIGDNCWFEDFVHLGAAGDLTIGDDCLIASFVYITDHDHGVEGAGSPRDRPLRIAATRVGSGVWLGHGAVILKGVEVGDGAVVGAGAVVTRSVPPRAVMAGVPARVIGTLSE